MPRPVHFELPADDPARAVSFYQSVFGWTVTKWEGPMEYWLVTTGVEGRGIDGGIMRREQPGASTVNTVEVPSLDEYVTKVESGGGQVVVPKMAIPGMGWLCYCMDTERNMFGMMEPDSSAK